MKKLEADKAAVDAKVQQLEVKLKDKAKEFDTLKMYLCSKDKNAPICK